MPPNFCMFDFEKDSVKLVAYKRGHDGPRCHNGLIYNSLIMAVYSDV